MKTKVSKISKILSFSLTFFLLIQLIAGIFLFLPKVQEVKATGTTYYVDSSITDTHVASATPDFTTYNPTTFATTGGSASVYKTIADINACTFSAGDSILFRRGKTWAEPLIPPSSGSSGNPIIFGAYGTGLSPRISGSGSYSVNSTKSYITYQYIDFYSRTAYVNGGDTNVFNYCGFTEVVSNGVYLLNAPNAALYNCVISNNSGDGVLGNGITSSATLRNCIIIGNGSSGKYGIRMSNSSTIDYDYCLITGNNRYQQNNISTTGGTYTDGGHNLLKYDPKIISASRQGTLSTPENTVPLFVPR